MIDLLLPDGFLYKKDTTGEWCLGINYLLISFNFISASSFDKNTVSPIAVSGVSFRVFRSSFVTVDD